MSRAAGRGLPLALLAVVVLADALIAATDPRVGPLLGALDEPAHLATAGLVLLNLPPQGRAFVVAALVASVAIDLDHLPLELGSSVLTEGTPRPYTHSLVGVAAIAALTLALTRRGPVAAGVLTGLLAHLMRDVATGSGVSLAWPLTAAAAGAPYALYLAALAVLTALALRNRPRTLRQLFRRSD